MYNENHIKSRREILKHLIILLSLLLMSSCGGGGSGGPSAPRTAYLLPDNSVSLGSPDTPLLNANYLSDKAYKFAWYNLFIPVVSAVGLTETLFRNTENPTPELFTQATLNVLSDKHARELSKYQDAPDYNYNELLQIGISGGSPTVEVFASAGHVAYGLIFKLWLSELDLKRQVYEQVRILNPAELDSEDPTLTFAGVMLPATLTTQSSTYTFTDYTFTKGTQTFSYFTGWAEGTNTLAVRSAYEQEDPDFSFLDSVESAVSTNSITVLISKEGKPLPGFTTNPYKVILQGTKDDANNIEIAARLYRPGWEVNIKEQATTNTSMGRIVIQVHAEPQTNDDYLMRVDYAQCPTITAENACNSALLGAITGSEVYNIKMIAENKSLLDIGNKLTSGPTPTATTIPVPTFWTDTTATFRLKF